MLNEERIILMTRMASYEQNEGRENVKIGNYFRSDYITLQVLKSIVCSALVFVILFGLYLLCNFEDFMQKLYDIDDLIAFAIDVLTNFCIVVGSYAALTYVVFTWRYASAKRSLKKYYHNLKKLNSLYQETR